MKRIPTKMLSSLLVLWILLMWLPELSSLAAATTPSLPTTYIGNDEAEMILVPAGSFLMGSTAEEVATLQKDMQRLPFNVRSRVTDQEPQHRVDLDAFYMDRYAVTNALYATFTQATRRLAPRFSHEPKFNQPQQPVVGVTWRDAEAYCMWAGKRLPTEAEWEKAARGPDGQVYPWGSTFDGTRLNYCDNRCPFDWRDKAVDDGYATTAPVGSYETGKSPYGLYDTAGNVWEWVADWYMADYYQQSPARHPTGPAFAAPAIGKRKVVRGGGWFSPAFALRAATRQNFEPLYWGDNIGFRCALTPQP